MKKRLFTFGCSFTEYLWPTWANILGREFEIFQNWGKCGAGNQFILHALVECNQKNKLTQDDVVCIMWTNFCREDRYVNKSWLTPGNIFGQNLYDKEFVKKFADIRGYYIRDLSSIWLADQILEKIGCKTYFFSMVDIDNPLQIHDARDQNDARDQIQDLLEVYSPLIKKVHPSVHRVIFNLDWNSRPLKYFTHSSTSLRMWRIWYKNIQDTSWPTCEFPNDFNSLPEHIQMECKQNYGYNELIKEISRQEKEEKQFRDSILKGKYKIAPNERGDYHPTPIEHLEYLQTVFKDIPLSQSTVDWVNEISTKGLQGESYDHLYLDEKTLACSPLRW
jgi:hypothetical protein